jgi:predicted NUDIX family phosphoesterase
MAKLDGSEQVLCAPADINDRLGRWAGYCPIQPAVVPEALETILSAARFLPRTVSLEQGQRGLQWRQIIPYVILRRRGTDRVFVYRRPSRGGDARLRECLSVGLGGHVNPVDSPTLNPPWIGGLILANCAERELREEVGIDSPCTMRQVGLINDESNDVGRRHLGVVCLVDTDAEPRPARLEVEDRGWHDPRGIRTHPPDQWEGWSRILVPHMGSIVGEATPTPSSRAGSSAPLAAGT